MIDMLSGYEFPCVEVISFVPCDVVATSNHGVVDENGNILLPEVPIRP